MLAPEHHSLHLLGIPFLVIMIKRCHVALELLLQLIEVTHCLIKCPTKTTTVSTVEPLECWLIVFLITTDSADASH